MRAALWGLIGLLVLKTGYSKERHTKSMVIICALSCFFLAMPASAATSYSVTGVVDEIWKEGAVTPPIDVGSTLTGQFTFEVLTPRTGGGINFSYFPGAVTSVSLELSGLSPITISGTGGAQSANHVGSGLGNIDFIEIMLLPGEGATVPAIEGLSFDFGILAFADDTDTLFLTDPPPLVNPDHALLSPWYFSFAWGEPHTQSIQVLGTFTIARQESSANGPSQPPVPSCWAALALAW